MITHVVIHSIMILLLAFELSSARAALFIGQEIAGPNGARHIQDAITPPLAAKIGMLIQISFFGCIIAAFFVHGWVLGLLLIPGSFIAVGAVQRIGPSPSGRFFRNIIVRSMMNRHAGFERRGDTIRARAIADLLERMGHSLPESLRTG